MALSSALAALVTFIAFILDIALFSIARHEFRKFGWSSQYGNAMWMTLGALVALLLGFAPQDVVYSARTGVNANPHTRHGK
jgi:hypothetical protein